MQSPICTMLGIEFPLLAFSHCRDVVVAVSKAGGIGVFGAASLPPERLEEELAWIDEHIGGRPYGVDLIVPNSFAGKGEARSALPPIPSEPASIPSSRNSTSTGIPSREDTLLEAIPNSRRMPAIRIRPSTLNMAGGDWR